MQDTVALLMIGTVVATFGVAALAVYGFRSRRGEKFLLWFGLFSFLYGTGLIARSGAFRPEFGQTDGVRHAIVRLIAMSAIVPGLLLFEEFYGRGWRSSVRWLTAIYSVLVVVAIGGVLVQLPLDLSIPPGFALVIMVPVVLTMGRVAGYTPPAFSDSRFLFAGLIAFFGAFSADRLLHVRLRGWHPGFEPYGFFALVVCLGYVTAQRVIADERRLLSLSDEMRAARKIQQTLLPQRTPSLENIHLAVRYAPMTAVAGDLYAFPTVNRDGIGVLLADVKGHGVPAALVASMVKIAVSTQDGNQCSPAKIITALNTILCREAQEQYVTAVYLYLDAVSLCGRYCAAGHPPGFVWKRKRQALELLDEPGLLLGVRPDEVYVERQFCLDAGDRLLLYTDGLVDGENAAEEAFGESALPAFMLENQDASEEQFVDLLLQRVLTWSSDGPRRTQQDDITALVIDVAETPVAQRVGSLNRFASADPEQRSSDCAVPARAVTA